MVKLLLMGCGNMGYAMLSRWSADGSIALMVVEPDGALRARAVAHGSAGVASASDLDPEYRPDVVVVATKPRLVGEVLVALRPWIEAGSLVASVAAGVPEAVMRASLPTGVGIVRCMPNTPASIGEGMIVCHADEACTARHRSLAERLFSVVGTVAFVEDEGLMDAVTAVSGSGPAYVFHFIECLLQAGERAGLPPDLAMLLAKQTVFGAAALASRSDEDPARLRERVTSPGGTTAAGLAVLMDASHGLANLVEACVEAAKRRSHELGAA